MTSSWQMLGDLVKPHRRTLVFAGLLTLAGSAGGLVMPLFVRAVIDRFGAGESVLGPVLLLSVVVLLGASISALGQFVLERMGEGIVLSARVRLVDRVLRLRVPEVDRLKPGDLLARVTSDTTLLRTVTTEGLVGAVGSAVLFTGAAVLMGVMDWVLLVVTLGVVAGVGGLGSLLLPRIRAASLRAQEALGDMGSALDRALQAFRTVKASGAEAREIGVVEAAARKARDRGVRSSAYQSIAGTTAWLSVQLAFLVVLAVGGARVASGAMTIATLIAFLLYLFFLVAPLGQMVQAATQLQNGLAALTRIREIDDLPVEPAATQGQTTGVPVGVVFEDVVFRYGDDRPIVHHGVSFEAPAGRLSALVGPSGAGKSTVFGLVERFYEPTSGRIAVGGTDIADWHLPDLRAAVGYVEQDAPVLDGTLRENLTFAAPDVTEEEIRRALARTRLDDLVERLPEGLETQVGHRGVLLSGGERQRVAIARALLRRPRLLLLDEATSQLDAVNELRLREVIAEVARETTVLVIAHRLSTVTGADRIIVMEAGRVRASGTHDELIAQDDLYRELAATQFLVNS
ncbi:ABC transporter ATP-binding protein [Herbidospora sp. NBRC 101105]|uniref:ABC transporter ATP-binding protein n=1 Tax=Herbidospora sp. NBRC 101105 TaxID=3032195 RepID=UPI0024A29517|nr:ABC transporter ATP-binding protein [Herbidospora sp. NBRC 101105]GLX98110.1 putative ABC transporter ATP-binding protein [Herbidospora sp. NBRC 101105]